MKNILVSVGSEHNNTFKKLDRVFTRTDFAGKYKEELMQQYPFLFYDNTNEKAIHITIADQEDIEEILKIAGKSVSITGSYLFLSLLWNFPRKKFNENTLWDCLSGFFYNEISNRVVEGSKLVISNNSINESASKVADEVIEYINAKLRCPQKE